MVCLIPNLTYIRPKKKKSLIAQAKRVWWNYYYIMISNKIFVKVSLFQLDLQTKNFSSMTDR